jgi:gamma-glutamylputrescine oxidase
MRLVAGSELRSLVGSPLYAGGLYDPDGGHLHPVKLALGLARAVGALGGPVHEATPVARWEPHAGRIRVHCSGGQVVDCEQLVVAANVGIGGIAGPGMRRLAQRILPVGTWVIATAPLSEDLAASVLPGGCAVADNRMIMDYFRLSHDRRLIFGGGCSYLGEATPPGFAEQLQRRMLKVFPQLHGVAVEYAWGGVLDISMNRAPDAGPLDGNPQVFHAQGFSGSGVVASCAVGTALAQGLQGDGRALGLIARVPHRRFPGGTLLRAPITAAGMLWHRALDLW